MRKKVKFPGRKRLVSQKRRRWHPRKNPLAQLFGKDAAALVADAWLFTLARGLLETFGMTPLELMEKINLAGASSAKFKDCVCGGQCLCHGTVIGGAPCPTSCPHFGDHLDGCHRCDCPEGPKKKAKP